MPTSLAQQKAVNKHIKGNYDRINLAVPNVRKNDTAMAMSEPTSSMDIEPDDIQANESVTVIWAID